MPQKHCEQGAKIYASDLGLSSPRGFLITEVSWINPLHKL